MTPEQIAEIRARAEDATAGPWEAHWQEQPGWMIDRIGDNDNDPGDEIAVLDVASNDADFIAHSRTDVPALLDELERLSGIVAAVESVCDMYAVDMWPARDHEGCQPDPVVLVEDIRRALHPEGGDTK